MKRLFLALTLLMSVGALAETGREGGGGYVVACPNKPLLILDNYEATLRTISGTPELLSLENKDLDKTKMIIRKRLHLSASFGGQHTLVEFEHFLNTDDWIVVDDLNVQVDDTNTVYNGCEKIRVAHRQAKTVYVQKELVDLLSDGQIHVLALHEYLYAASELDSSERTRHVIRELLKSEKTFSRKKLSEKLSDLLPTWVPKKFTAYHNLGQPSMLSAEKLLLQLGTNFCEDKKIGEVYKYTKASDIQYKGSRFSRCSTNHRFGCLKNLRFTGVTCLFRGKLEN